jgi:hypothetical protein
MVFSVVMTSPDISITSQDQILGRKAGLRITVPTRMISSQVRLLVKCLMNWYVAHTNPTIPETYLFSYPYANYILSEFYLYYQKYILEVSDIPTSFI